MFDVSKKVLNQIADEGLKPKPKWIFWLSSLLMVLGFGAFIFVAGFLINLALFKLQHSAIMDCKCLDNAIMQCLTNDFPIGILILAVVGLVGGFCLFKKFEFAYKYPWWMYAVGEVVLVAIVALVLNISGVNYYSQPVLPDLYCKTTGYGCCKDGQSGSACAKETKEAEKQMKEVTKQCAGKCLGACQK